MTWVPGGSFRMGSADFYPEERPVHRVAVDGFWMDSGPVTVAGQHLAGTWASAAWPFPGTGASRHSRMIMASASRSP